MLARDRATSPALLLAVSLGTAIITVWPLQLVPDFPRDDKLLHLLSGAALALGVLGLRSLACRSPGGATVVAVPAVASVAWEPIEAVWYRCLTASPANACLPAVARWFLLPDTVTDMVLVLVGAGLVGCSSWADRDDSE